MRAMAILLLAALILAGCASPEKPNAAAGQPAVGQPAAQDPGPAPALTFSREAPPQEMITPETKFQEMPTFDFSNKTTADGRLIVYYFKSSGCIASRELQPEIDRLQAKYPGIEWRTYDILTQNGTWAYLDFAEQRNLSLEKRLVPQVLVNGSIITDRFNINGSLEGILRSYGAS